jgi:hypothetical protein
VNEFVDECRREWRRLGVPDPIASEMAADLTADLEEAEAEGGSPEDVLGNSAFDPRRFAAAWAAARGVTSTPAPERRPLWRPPIAIAVAVVLGVLTIGTGLALLVGRSGSSIAFATRRIVAAPGPIRLFAPGAGRIVVPGPLGRVFGGTAVAGVDILPLVFMVFLVGLAVVAFFAVLCWSRWAGPRRYRRRDRPQSPSWN